MNYLLRAYYEGDNCDGSPYLVEIESSGDSCLSETCVTGDTEAFGSTFVVCSSDFEAATNELYGDDPYVIGVMFTDTDCTTYDFGSAYFLGACAANFGDGDFIKILVNANKTATIETFEDASCSSKVTSTRTIGEETLASNSCDSYVSRWYNSQVDDDVNSNGLTLATTAHSGGSSSNSTINSSSNGLISAGSSSPMNSSSKSSDKTAVDSIGITPRDDVSSVFGVGSIIGIIVAAVVVVIILATFFYRFRHLKAKHKESQFQDTTSLQSRDTSSLQSAMQGQKGLWDDDVITAKRLPRDKIKVKKLLSRGASGEVFSGVFNRQQVAIKKLIPNTRTNMQHVNDFLAEAKMTALMDHPHVVAFIGVAWDSLSDLCVVLEFMDGGDLRSLLDKHVSSGHSVGFDHEKTTIALHVCHALTYLHSLAPPVIHRDLKSRNILLNKAMEAKLTDFGISKERLDRTMTANVGTSLWMAPEIMLGKRYDVKADLFSFGVVLSEIDVHTLPYAYAKKRNREVEGRELSEATLLQRVAMGSVQVEFSDSALRSMVELGRACVSVNPNDRPSAAEALYKIQRVLAHELS